jgi:hypothetical protein
MDETSRLPLNHSSNGLSPISMALCRLLDPNSGFQQIGMRWIQTRTTDKFIRARKANYSFPVFISETIRCHIALSSLSEAGGFHDMNLAIRALASANDSAASAAVNARSVRRADVIKV